MQKIEVGSKNTEERSCHDHGLFTVEVTQGMYGTFSTTCPKCLEKGSISRGGPVSAGTTWNNSAGDGPEYFTPGVTGKITPSVPQWTKEPPTVPGWYWCRTILEDGTDEADKGTLVEAMKPGSEMLYRHARMIHFITPHVDLRWCGPLTPPE